jgi:ATP-binding protein involved in chromosome partitioning
MIRLTEHVAGRVRELLEREGLMRLWPRRRDSGAHPAAQRPAPAPVSEAEVLAALRPIVDPDFGKSIVDLGLVKNLAIECGRVSFEIQLTTPACPVKAEFEKAAHERVLALPGVTDVAVRMTANTRGRRAALGAPSAEALPEVKNVIAVASGKGGVGKSTTALNLALALKRAGAQVGLMDADVYGPSLSILTGVTGRPRMSAERRILPHQGHGLKLMSMAFLVTDESPVIWRGPMVHGLVRQFLTDVEWGELDYLVVDMPPGTGDAALTLAQQAPLSGAVIVTTANELSLIDARKGLKMFERVQVPVLGIVENMAHFTLPDLPDRRYYLFGRGGARRTAERLGVDFLGEVPIDPRIVEGGDAGRPILLDAPESEAARAFGAIAEKVVRKLAVLAEVAPKIVDANITWVST